MSKSDFVFYKEATMSQRLSNKDGRYSKFAGSDQAISDKLAFFEALGELGLIDLKTGPVKVLMVILDYKRVSRFATSERTNEITKMGLLMPKEPDESDYNDETK